MLSFLFYILCSIIIVSSLLVVTSSNPVYSVFYLILGFCNAAAILLLFELEFLGFLLLIIYVGAIAVLFLFVVMMLNVPVLKEPTPNIGFFLFSFIFVCSFFLFFTNSFNTSNFLNLFYFSWASSVDSFQNVLLIGDVLYSYAFVPFLISGFILLVAIVGAIVLTLNRNVSQSPSLVFRKQRVFQQLSRRSKKAVFLFKRNLC